jgi:hypothetical protein
MKLEVKGQRLVMWAIYRLEEYLMIMTLGSGGARFWDLSLPLPNTQGTGSITIRQHLNYRGVTGPEKRREQMDTGTATSSTGIMDITVSTQEKRTLMFPT